MWKRRCLLKCRRSIRRIKTFRVFSSIKSKLNTRRRQRAEHQSESQYAPTFQMPRSPRCLPHGYSFHITLRCNSRQFLIAKGLRRDVLLAVLSKAQAKVPHRLYAVCLMANHLHLLIRPEDASKLPRLMHWLGWFQQWHSTVLRGVADTSGRQGITPPPLPQETTEEC